MSKHSIQSQSFLIFCSLVMTLSACSQSYAGRFTILTTPSVTASEPTRQTLAAKSNDNQQNRQDYQAIALSKIGTADKLQGSDPKAIALRVFRNTEPEGGKSEVTVETDFPRAVVIVTQIGVGDDSIRGIRYRAEFVATQNTVPPEKEWTLVWAGSQVKCQPGRGHQNWSIERCL